MPAGVTLAAGTATAEAGEALVSLASGTVTQPGYLTLRAQAVNEAGLSGEARRRFVVMPSGMSGTATAPQLLASPARVKSGESLTFLVAGAAGYAGFSWAVVRGPHVLAGSPTGPQLSITAPQVSSPTDLVVRVALAFTGPVSASNPPIHVLEAQARIEP